MKTAIATVSLSGVLREKLDAVAAAGFRAVEIFEADLIAHPGPPSEVKAICADLGLQILCFQPFRDFEGMTGERRAKAFDRAERKFDLMTELGADLLLVCSNVSPDAQGGADRLAADFAELGDRAAKRGVRIGYEALAWGRHVNDYRDSWEVVRRAGRANVGVILDTFHIQARGTELGSMRAIPADRIFLVQVADAPRLDMDYLNWSRHYRCMPGQGDLPLDAFMDALGATGYAGALSLEIFNDRFRADGPRAVALDGRRSLLSMLDDHARRSGAPASALMPARAPAEDVEFVEFAVDDSDRAALEGILAALGFARVGRHRSKDAALWTSGGVRIVVNADKEGFAHSFHVTHGASVCALALRVPDARATLERARLLLETPHRGATGPGELDVPAVRGPGGGLVYFIDRASALGRWADTDFEPTGEKAGTTLTRVDHVSQTMRHEETLTWVLFYRALFRSSSPPLAEVVDPGGVVQSQVVESGVPDDGRGGARFVVNASQSARTMSSRFLEESFGSGVQHVALAADDLRATVRRFRAAGGRLLPIPANYYDDLAARADLSEADVAELKSLDIMWDRDAGGAFLQAYTVALDDGFFFELVQRDGYRGYGAPNAGVRLAAQARLARPAGMPRH
ncbi:MAG: sugar phosphate isomerase/epimerase and 4-hydroxyphenylpyruvate domain-containing protein [Hyphomicrobiales bacterium]|nr:sugar phosphate isomerase/epimerase and 4-hydroxyphenylpyruvate domain-containing protein [Hyphomicrobiales bacterium]